MEDVATDMKNYKTRWKCAHPRKNNFNSPNNLIPKNPGLKLSETKDQTSAKAMNTNNPESSTSSTSLVKAPPLSEEELREHEETKSKLTAFRDKMASVKSENEYLTSLMPEIIEALSFNSSEASEQELRVRSIKLQVLLGKVLELLKTKSEERATLEKQNLALTLQTKSLKDVVGITKDLLGIRNMEVEHLQVDIKKLEGQINNEKERHNNMLNKMGDVLKLNQSLKTEYETQLGLFQDLRRKYEEKVTLLQSENKRLERLAYPSTSAEEPSSSKVEDGTVDSETASQSQEGNIAENESPVLAEISNCANTKKDSQSQSDVMDEMVNNTNEEGNVTKTEAQTVDIVKEDTEVATQQVNTAATVNTPTSTGSGGETLTVDAIQTL